MKRRGFTLVELSVIVIILAMFAASTAPNMASMIEGGKRRGFRQSVLTLIRQAKEEAVTRGQVVWFASTSDAGFEISTTIDDQETTLKEITPVDGVTAANFMKAGAAGGEGDWRVAFYPDGTCEGGSFEFQEAGATRSVSISKRNGGVTLADGEVDTSKDPDQEWQAGEYEKSG